MPRDSAFNTEFVDLRRQTIRRFFSRLNDRQFEVLCAVNGPVLVLAGAGSGKTTVLVSRIAAMIRFGDAFASGELPPGADADMLHAMRSYVEWGECEEEALRAAALDPIRPYRILAITFTNKAANELKERLTALLGDTAADIAAGTFHSICVRILRREIQRLGYAQNFTIYDQDDSLRVIKNILKQRNIDDKVFPPRSVLSAISRAKDSLLTPAEYAQTAHSDFRKQQVAEVYADYMERLRAANAVDFDDIINLTVELFHAYPEVLSYYQNRWKYVLVDEYQDTNHAQYQFISLLAREHHNICVVGDDDQSIYRFRGANIENILNFEDENPGCVTVRLEENYRSTKTVLDAANAVIENNQGRKGKTLWTGREEGRQLVVAAVADEQAEAQYIADTVTKGLANGRKLADHAVLYRLNAQSNAIERVLVKSGIPYRVLGSVRFYDRKEIKDVLAYLSVVDNTSDTLRLTRILNTPKRGIGDTTVAAALDIANGIGHTLFEVLEQADEYPALARKAKDLKAFASMIRELQGVAELGDMEYLMNAVLDKSGYLLMLQSEGEEGRTRLENVEELMSTIVRYGEENEEPSLSGFLEEISLISDIDGYDANADAVILMTIHAAKGLEFPVVLLPGLEDGIFPAMRSIIEGPQEVEEERRLMYVALTRAKDELHILHTDARLLFGSTQRNLVSRFVKEIPPELCDFPQRKHSRLTSEPGAQKSSLSIGGDAGRRIGTGGVGIGAPGAAATQFAAGDTVTHNVFGPGTVLAVTPMGNDTLVEVAFESHGTKKIMANFAKLKKQ